MKAALLGLLSAFLLAGFFSSCRRQTPPEDWVAQVGNTYITLNEFRTFYETDPNFALDSLGLPALYGELHTLIDQYLAVKQAQNDGLANDPILRRAIRWERKQAMLRALYRQTIGSKIQITEEDLRRAYRQKNEMVHVRHLFTKNPAQAQRWYKQLKSGKANFKELAAKAFRDSILKTNGGDLGWAKVAELDQDFVRGLDTLRPGEISRPVKTHWGYHIIQMIDAKVPAIVRESDFARQRPALERWLKQQKGLALSRKYIAQTLGKLNPQPDTEVFMRLWYLVSGAQNLEQPRAQHTLALDNATIARLETKMSDWLDRPFIHFKGGHVTLRQFLLGMKEIPTSHRPEFRTPHQLSLQIARWFRDEYLFKQAKDKGLQNDPQVQKEVAAFERQEIYYYYVQQMVDTLSVPPAVKTYFQQKDRSAPPDRNLLKFNTLTEWKWSRAQHLLHLRLRALPVPVHIRQELLKEENKQIDWRGRVRMFMVRKPS